MQQKHNLVERYNPTKINARDKSNYWTKDLNEMYSASVKFNY